MVGQKSCCLASAAPAAAYTWPHSRTPPFHRHCLQIAISRTALDKLPSDKHLLYCWLPETTAAVADERFGGRGAAAVTASSIGLGTIVDVDTVRVLPQLLEALECRPGDLKPLVCGWVERLLGAAACATSGCWRVGFGGAGWLGATAGLAIHLSETHTLAALPLPCRSSSSWRTCRSGWSCCTSTRSPTTTPICQKCPSL